MFDTNITHFLNGNGNIDRSMPKEARQVAGFLVLVIDASTLYHEEEIIETKIRCFKKHCEGMVKSKLVESDILWLCPACANEGRISNWQDTKWNNGMVQVQEVLQADAAG